MVQKKLHSTEGWLVNAIHGQGPGPVSKEQLPPKEKEKECMPSTKAGTVNNLNSSLPSYHDMDICEILGLVSS